MNFGSPQRPKANINVAKLIMSESGTYNPLYSRPYQTYMDGTTMNTLIRRVEENDGKVTGSLLAGVAGNILSPSPTPGHEIPIPMGWAERRIRFILEVHVTTSTGSQFIYFFQGYTSHLGVSNTGAVDPAMEFIVNSYIRVTRANQFTNAGMVVQDVVTESAHIVNGAIMHNYTNQDVFGMRPKDIAVGIQSNYLSQAYQSHFDGSLKDTRIKINTDAIRSNRQNNLPTNYISKIIDSYQTAKQLADFGQTEQDIIGRTQNLLHEEGPYENIFLRALGQTRGLSHATTFTFQQLELLDQNVKNVTTYVTMGQTQQISGQMHQAGQTEYWHGTNRETVAASLLSNAIPAIMMDLMISKVAFRATNCDIGGQIQTMLIDAKSLTNADMRANYEMFKRRLEREVLFDLTYGNAVTFMLDMRSDMFGETMITLTLDNGPMITYATPSFCDSLMTPIMTMNKDNYHTVVSDFETIMNSLPGGMASQSSAVNSIV